MLCAHFQLLSFQCAGHEPPDRPGIFISLHLHDVGMQYDADITGCYEIIDLGAVEPLFLGIKAPEPVGNFFGIEVYGSQLQLVPQVMGVVVIAQFQRVVGDVVITL